MQSLEEANVAATVLGGPLRSGQWLVQPDHVLERDPERPSLRCGVSSTSGLPRKLTKYFDIRSVRCAQASSTAASGGPL